MVVAHDAVNKTILCALLGLTPADIWAVKQGNGGVTVIDYPNGADQAPVVVCLNQTAHLGGVIDRTAAGWGWLLDPTPWDDFEFLPRDPSSRRLAFATGCVAADCGMDLLTVLWHELGHVLGRSHVDDPWDLMAQSLVPAVRRLPETVDAAFADTNSIVFGTKFTDR